MSPKEPKRKMNHTHRPKPIVQGMRHHLPRPPAAGSRRVSPRQPKQELEVLGPQNPEFTDKQKGSAVVMMIDRDPRRAQMTVVDMIVSVNSNHMAAVAETAGTETVAADMMMTMTWTARAHRLV
jgi:hypothetical protein